MRYLNSDELTVLTLITEVISQKADRTGGLNHAGDAFRGGSRTLWTCPEIGVEPR